MEHETKVPLPLTIGESYIGDGVYARFDGYQIWIHADRDGRRHEIALEWRTLEGLNHYAARLAEALKTQHTAAAKPPA
jgi:hypothetical protein